MDWTRGHTLGRGSSATVSAATSRSSGDTFAVKSAELSKSEFLERERKILSELSSPHVVGYIGYEVTTENNKVICNLLMEYVSGGTLTDEIRRRGGRIEEAEIGVYTTQIVQGLDYLHSMGIAHCDIKGQNILIGESKVKVADFGSAKRITPAADDVAAPIGGTPMFMAPEVARGEEQGCPADIWSLGCTVIEMATGDSPWPGVADPVSVLYRIAFSGDLPEFPDFLSEQARDFLGKCLRREPKDRWTAKQLLKHPFLAESNSLSKQFPEFNSNSPTSILDQGVWNSTDNSETMDFLIHPSRRSISPAERIGRLSSCSGVPTWTWHEDWITIRGESDTFSGFETSLVNYDMELEETVNDEELVGRNCSLSSNILMVGTCTEHRAVVCSERREKEFL